MELTRKCSVVAADAEPLARRGLVQAINEHPLLHLCAEAESIAQARELCALHRPHVMVLDPAQGNGFALIQDLQRWSAETRVVVLTGLEDTASVQRAFKCGALGYVTRRDPVTTLLGAILGAAAGERHLGPRAERMLLGELARGAVRMDEGELGQLSPREREVFRRIGAGQATRLIAEELHMSVKTVETHRQRIKEKLGLASGAELMRRAVLFGSNSQEPR